MNYKKCENMRRKALRFAIASLALGVLLASSLVMLQNTVTGEEPQTTEIFTDPLMVQTTGVDQNFTVNINISNVVDLYAWQAGITFNPEVLECMGFYEGEFLKRSNETTLFVKHIKDMNNTLGIVYFRGTCILGPKPGVNGSGQLAYLIFKSVGIGVSDFHLTDIVLLNAKLENIEFEVLESFTVGVYGTNYGVNIANNLTGEYSSSDSPISGVFDTAFNMTDKKISFEARGLRDWFCQVSVPKTLLACNASSEWTIKVDGNPISYTVVENSTHTSLLFENYKGNHKIEIIGTELALIGPHDLTLPLLFIAIVGFVTLTAALIDLKKTKNVLRYKATNSAANYFL
jgi:hypothetical protein